MKRYIQWAFFTGLVLMVQSAHGQEVFAPPEQPPTIEAFRATSEVRIDGKLEESDWQTASPVSGFTQEEPEQGGAPSFDTEVRVLYDDDNLYISAICYDADGPTGIRVQDLRRDFDFFENDVFGVSLDPFSDERNAIIFQVNPYGVLRDLQVTDGNIFNIDWDATFEARTSIEEDRWTAEIAIPWNVLRYSQDQKSWGINFVRGIRRFGEFSGWSLWPRVFSPYRMDYAGVLENIEPPPPSTNLRVQPYLVMRDERVGEDDELLDAVTPEIGGDLKWAVSSNTVLDLTVNTDFAQADADRQVVNLSRFSVFFPERRAFFLENASLFRAGSSIAALPFFSRRIGLDSFGQPIPIDAGARLISRTESRNIGALFVRQRSNNTSPVSHFGVARYSQNLGNSNRVGALATFRQDESYDGNPAELNMVGAIDGLFRFTNTITLQGMVSGSLTKETEGDGLASYVWLANRTNRGYLGHVQAIVSEDYNPGVGFVPRRDFMLTSPAGNLDLRPDWKPAFIRSFKPGFVSYIYHRLSDGAFQEAWLTLTPISIQFINGAVIDLSLEPNWQTLESQDIAFFRPLGVGLNAGEYTYVRYNAELQSDLSRRYSGALEVTTGPYFDGRLTTVSATARLAPSPHMALSLDYELNRATNLGVESENVDSHLFGPELRLALNPRFQFNAFYQYNTLAERARWNVRLSYEFNPLSYVFLVFNDNRYFVNETLRRSNPDFFATQQQVIFKVSYLRQL